VGPSAVLVDQTNEMGELLKDKKEQDEVVSKFKTREKELNQLLAAKKKQAQQLQSSITAIVNREIAAAKKEADKRIFSPNHLLSESHLTQKLSWCDLNLEIRRAQQRLQDARRMHNEAVRATRYVRSWRISRWLRLTGRAPAPNFVDFDDSLFPIQNRD
jgi:hypothetical protein